MPCSMRDASSLHVSVGKGRLDASERAKVAEHPDTRSDTSRLDTRSRRHDLSGLETVRPDREFIGQPGEGNTRVAEYVGTASLASPSPVQAEPDGMGGKVERSPVRLRLHFPIRTARRRHCPR